LRSGSATGVRRQSIPPTIHAFHIWSDERRLFPLIFLSIPGRNRTFSNIQEMIMETFTTLMDHHDDDSSPSQSSRLNELREKQKSLRESMTLSSSSSQLSLLFMKSDNSDEDDAEKISRGLRKIRVRRPSKAFKVEMNGMVEQIELFEGGKKSNDEKSVSERSTTSQTSTRSSDPLSLRNMFGKVTGKTVLANHPPIKEQDETELDPLSLKNMLGKAKGKTVLAQHPPAKDQDPEVTEQSSDDDESFASSSAKAGGSVKISLF
jgi:hypothetical protein